MVEDIKRDIVRHREDDLAGARPDAFFFERAQGEDCDRVFGTVYANAATMTAFFELGFGDAWIEALARQFKQTEG